MNIIDRRDGDRRAITLQLLGALAVEKIEIKDALVLGAVQYTAPEDRGCFDIPVRDGISPIHVNVNASERSSTIRVMLGLGLGLRPTAILRKRRDGTINTARFVELVRQLTELSQEEFRQISERDDLDAKLKKQRERIVAHQPNCMSRTCFRTDVQCRHVGLADVTFQNLTEAEAIKLLQTVSNMRLRDEEG